MSFMPSLGHIQAFSSGPSPVTNTRLPPPRLPPPPSRVTNPAGKALPVGSGQFPQAKPGAPAVNTAPPPNPWTKDPNIYGPADTGWLDALRQQLEQGQATDKTNFDARLADIGKGGPVERITSKDQDYTRTQDFGDAVSVLKELSRTGGYSDADLGSLRARGASPIRAAYAKAERDLNRTKAIQGGYAPGFAAASLRMAREQGDLASEAMQKVNADIAEKVASGRITSAGKYGDVTGQENTLVTGVGTGNAQRRAAADAANALAANQAALQAQELRAGVYKDVGDANRKYGDQAVSLADLKQRAIDAAKRGQLDERNTSRAGALDWEKFNQSGGQALIDALLKQYGAR